MSKYTWVEHKHPLGSGTYMSVTTDQCEVTLEGRPYYCDRGRYLAKVFPRAGSELFLSLDQQDGWPRYYYDKDRAIAEVEAWLSFRNYKGE